MINSIFLLVNQFVSGEGNLNQQIHKSQLLSFDYEIIY